MHAARLPPPYRRRPWSNATRRRPSFRRWPTRSPSASPRFGSGTTSAPAANQNTVSSGSPMLSLNLITGFSLLPIQALSLTGIGDLPARRGVRRLPARPSRDLRPAAGRRAVGHCSRCCFPVRAVHVPGARPDRRVRRPDLQRSAPPPNLYRARGPRRRSHGERSGADRRPRGSERIGDWAVRNRVRERRCVLFAYHEMGYACHGCAARFGRAGSCALHPRGQPRRGNLVAIVRGARARRAAIPIYTPETLDRRLDRDRIAALAPDGDLFILLSQSVVRSGFAPGVRSALSICTASLLPRYRGRAPVNWVLVNGERETGVTLHHMVARADAGDIVAQRADRDRR